MSQANDPRETMVIAQTTGLINPVPVGQPGLVSKEALAAQAVLVKKMRNDEPSVLEVLRQDIPL